MDMMEVRRRVMLSMGNLKKVEFGTYTPTEDIYASQAHIAHRLGVVPNFVIVVADEIILSVDVQKRYISNSYCAISNLVASDKNASGFAAYQMNRQASDITWRATENINYEKFLHQDTFEVPYYSTNDTLKAGVTYYYVIGVLEQKGTDV